MNNYHFSIGSNQRKSPRRSRLQILTYLITALCIWLQGAAEIRGTSGFCIGKMQSSFVLTRVHTDRLEVVTG